MSSSGYYKLKYELFKQFNYKCFSMSLQYYKCQYQESNRAIFPPSLLTRLKIENYNQNYPMFFELGCNFSDENDNQKKTHVGAAEFVGEEGVALLPEWVLENANIINGGVGFFKSVHLPRAEKLVMSPVELKPTDGEFLKVIMEKKLRDIVCLTVSDVIPVRLGSKTITIIVEDVKPGNAVSVINRNIQFSYDIKDESYNIKSVKYTRKDWHKDLEDRDSSETNCLDEVPLNNHTEHAFLDKSNNLNLSKYKKKDWNQYHENHNYAEFNDCYYGNHVNNIHFRSPDDGHKLKHDEMLFSDENSSGEEFLINRLDTGYMI